MLSIVLTGHHQRAHTLHPALHGGLHQSGEAVAIPPLDVQPGVVVEQVVGDGDVAWTDTRKKEKSLQLQSWHG